MEVSYIGVIRFDFFLSANEKQVRESLADIYTEQRDTEAAPEFFGLAPDSQLETRGTASVSRYTDIDQDKFDADSLGTFETVQTFLLHQDSRRFLDAVTVGTIARDEDPLAQTDTLACNNTIKKWQDALGQIGRQLNSIVFKDVFGSSYPLSPHSSILYVDCNSPKKVWADDGSQNDNGRGATGVNQDVCQSLIDECDRFGLSERGCTSVLASGELIGTQTVGEIWGPLTAVNIADSRQEYSFAKDTEIQLPDMGSCINRLLPFFRSYDWVHYRLNDCEIINDELVDTSTNVMDLDREREQSYLRTLMGEEEELGRIQNYLDYSEMVKELEDIDYLISEFDYEARDVQPPYPEFEIPVSEPTDTTLRSTTYFSDSLFKTYQNELRHLLKRLTDELETVDERHTRLSDIITDKITISGTNASIQLNDRVRQLTLGLVFLTVLLLVGQENIAMVLEWILPTSPVEIVVRMLLWNIY